MQFYHVNFVKVLSIQYNIISINYTRIWLILVTYKHSHAKFSKYLSLFRFELIKSVPFLNTYSSPVINNFQMVLWETKVKSFLLFLGNNAENCSFFFLNVFIYLVTVQNIPYWMYDCECNKPKLLRYNLKIG